METFKKAKLATEGREGRESKNTQYEGPQIKTQNKRHNPKVNACYPSFCKNPKVYAAPGKREAIFCQWIIDNRQVFVGLIWRCTLPLFLV